MNCLPERHLQVLPSPHIHLFIIGAQVPEGFPRYSKQASSHCRGSRIEEKNFLHSEKNAIFYMNNPEMISRMYRGRKALATN